MGFFVRWRERPNVLLPFWMLCIAFIHVGSGTINLIFGYPSAEWPTIGGLALAGSIGIVAWCFRARLSIYHNAFDYIAILFAMIALDTVFSLVMANELGLTVADQILHSTALLSTTATNPVHGYEVVPPGFVWRMAFLQGVGAIWFVQFTTVAIPSHVFDRLAQSDDFDLSSSATMTASMNRVWLSIIGVFVALVSLAACGFWLLGTSWVDGFVLSAALVSLGGQINYDASLSSFNDDAIYWFAIFVMLAGATNWLLHLRVVVTREAQGYASSRELQVFLLLVLFVTLIVTIFRALAPASPVNAKLITEAAVYTVSIITTTGVTASDYLGWGAWVTGLTAMLLVIGGCSGSPSGGIKIARLIYQVRVFGLILSGRRFAQIGHHTISLGSLQFMQMFMTIFLALIFVSTAVLSSLGLDFVTAFSITISNLTNLGVGLGAVVGPAGSYSVVLDSVKYWAILLMILGRIELGLVFVFISARYWLSPETLADDR